jgi:PAT family acetyl-CoA transporter-like MFS transporter 1
MEEEADRLIHGTGVVPSDASAKHQSTPPLTFAEKKMIVVLTLLYFIQGIPLGFWGSALPVLFTEAGSTFESLAILPSVLLPFSFKMITAPLIDTFYVSSIGKRRSYIIPIQYVMALMFLALGFADID